MARSPTRVELERRDRLWVGEHREDSLDNSFAAMRDRARTLTGLAVSVAADDAGYVGLPLPALCLRHLFQSTIYPLSKIAQVTGEEGSCKSAFLFEIMRWHMVYGGGAAFIENEDKDSPVLRNSILGWNPRWLRRLEVAHTYALEDWMDALTMLTQIATEQQTDPLGPGHTIPICLGVDSIMSTAPREEIAKVKETGHAARNYALAANLISLYMKTMPDRLKDYPFSIVGTNHLKPSTDYMGRPVANVSGGKSVKFHETYEIEMHRAPNCDIDLLEYGGIRLRLVLRKNSAGPSRKQIGAELLWWTEEYTNEHGQLGTRQQTAWDWDTASIELLLSFELAKGKKTIFNRLQEVCDLHVVSKGARMVWSQALGIPRDEPVHYRVAGSMLERRPDLLHVLYPLLGIQAHRAFEPGMDYRVLLARAREEADQEGQQLYGHVENMPRLDIGATEELALSPVAEDVLPTGGLAAAEEDSLTPPSG